MSRHEKINYVEFPAKDLTATKAFFQKVFVWQFIDYGPEYSSFSNQGLDGGFYQSEKVATTQNGSALIVFYSDNIEATLDKVKKADGKIVKDIFDFPGGRRFHFTEPSGNEFSVWTETKD